MFILQNIHTAIDWGLKVYDGLSAWKTTIVKRKLSEIIPDSRIVGFQMPQQKQQLQPESQNHVEDTATIGSLGNRACKLVTMTPVIFEYQTGSQPSSTMYQNRGVHHSSNVCSNRVPGSRKEMCSNGASMFHRRRSICLRNAQCG